jgi:hypothetical protein
MEDVLIYARNIIKDTRRRQERRKKLNSGDIKLYRG